ncbi:MAG: hypothetical protein ACRDH1_06680 [Actinomycetota bacterium]
MRLSMPPGLRWLRGSPAGRAWLERLPRLVDEFAERWSLRIGEPFPYAFASLAVPGNPAGRDRRRHEDPVPGS